MSGCWKLIGHLVATEGEGITVKEASIERLVDSGGEAATRRTAAVAVTSSGC